MDGCYLGVRASVDMNNVDLCISIEKPQVMTHRLIPLGVIINQLNKTIFLPWKRKNL